MSDRLLAQGAFVQGIRPPTVPAVSLPALVPIGAGTSSLVTCGLCCVATAGTLVPLGVTTVVANYELCPDSTLDAVAGFYYHAAQPIGRGRDHQLVAMLSPRDAGAVLVDVPALSVAPGKAGQEFGGGRRGHRYGGVSIRRHLAGERRHRPGRPGAVTDRADRIDAHIDVAEGSGAGGRAEFVGWPQPRGTRRSVVSASRPTGRPAAASPRLVRCPGRSS